MLFRRTLVHTFISETQQDYLWILILLTTFKYHHLNLYVGLDIYDLEVQMGNERLTEK